MSENLEKAMHELIDKIQTLIDKLEIVSHETKRQRRRRLYRNVQ